ncbi:MAG: YHS domain-containing protein [Proteobacteria bacterium]|nr:YHS domain-containing protein [Pseudomonadota bacterium]
MIRVLYLFILGLVFYWALKGIFRRPPQRRGKELEGEEMVQDPQCGVYVPKSRAIAMTRRGKQLYFCSEECKRKYSEKLRDEG